MAQRPAGNSASRPSLRRSGILSLTSVSEHCPELSAQLPAPVAKPPKTSNHLAADARHKHADHEHDERHLQDHGVQVVQFSSALYFVGEGDAHAMVDVMRIGQAVGKCSVKLKTADGSARAHVKYEPLEERIHFDAGEVWKTLKIPIINDDHFDTTLEFIIELHDPDDCMLGKYLGRARVIIEDNDTFPSNQFSDVINPDNVDEEILAEMSFALLWSFMKFVFLRVPGVWWRCIIYASLDQLQNVYYLANIYLKIYMVDVVLAMKEGDVNRLVFGSRPLSMLAVSAAYFLPNFLLTLIDWLKIVPLDVGRIIREHFKQNMFRKYLNYKESSKSKVPIQDLVMGMECDIPILVDDGFVFIFDMLRAIGKLLIVAVFMLCSNPNSLLPLAAYPLLAGIFVVARQTKQVELEHLMMEAEEDSAGCIVSGVQAFDIIRDYRMRQFFLDMFGRLTAKSVKSAEEFETYIFWNQQFIPAITKCCVAFQMAFGSQLVILGQMSIGEFLAIMDIYREWGDRFEGLYNNVQRGIGAASPMVLLTKLLNLSTDVHDRLEMVQIRRQHTLDLVTTSSFRDRESHSADVFDNIGLDVRGISTVYPTSIDGMTARVECGQVIYVTGAHGLGKTTLLRLLCDIRHLNATGIVLYGSHNRVLHVTNEPVIIPDLSLLENFSFGCRDIDHERVRTLFVRIGLEGSGLLQLLETEIEDAKIKTADASEMEQSDNNQSSILSIVKNASKRAAAMLQGMARQRGAAAAKPPDVREASVSAISRESSRIAGDELPEQRGLLASPRSEVSQSPRSSSPRPEGKAVVDLITGERKIESEEEEEWQKRLSFSEKKLINLGRALVFNPEILIISKPLDAIDTGVRPIILELFREFVDGRGAEMDESTYFLRRPRTLFFSGGQTMDARTNLDIADVVWSLGRDPTFVQMTPQEYLEGMLGGQKRMAASLREAGKTLGRGTLSLLDAERASSLAGTESPKPESVPQRPLSAVLSQASQTDAAVEERPFQALPRMRCTSPAPAPNRDSFVAVSLGPPLTPITAASSTAASSDAPRSPLPLPQHTNGRASSSSPGPTQQWPLEEPVRAASASPRWASTPGAHSPQLAGEVRLDPQLVTPTNKESCLSRRSCYNNWLG